MLASAIHISLAADTSELARRSAKLLTLASACGYCDAESAACLRQLCIPELPTSHSHA